MQKANLKQDGFRVPPLAAAPYPAPQGAPVLKNGERACTMVAFECTYAYGDSSTWAVRVWPSDDPANTWKKGVEFVAVLETALTTIVELAPPVEGLTFIVSFYRALSKNLADVADGPDHVEFAVDVEPAKARRQALLVEYDAARADLEEENARAMLQYEAACTLLTERHRVHEQWLMKGNAFSRLMDRYWMWWFNDPTYTQNKEAYEQVESGRMPSPPVLRRPSVPPRFDPIAWSDAIIASSAAERGKQLFLHFMRSMHSLQWGNNPARRKLLEEAGVGTVVETMMASAVDEHPQVVRTPRAGGARGTWKPPGT